MHVGEISPVTRSLWFQRASMNQARAFPKCSPRVHGCCGTGPAPLDASHMRICSTGLHVDLCSIHG